jgi:hypothetical protein
VLCLIWARVGHYFYDLRYGLRERMDFALNHLCYWVSSIKYQTWSLADSVLQIRPFL